MAITLSQLDAPLDPPLTLPEDLIWTDEFDWTSVEQSVSYAVDGTQIIETGLKKKGRPITLAGEQSYGWITRADLTALYALAQVPGPYLLTLHGGREFQVDFRHADQPIEAKPLIHFSQPNATDCYTLILRLMEV
jgi:hypothetical protein